MLVQHSGRLAPAVEVIADLRTGEGGGKGSVLKVSQKKILNLFLLLIFKKLFSADATSWRPPTSTGAPPSTPCPVSASLPSCSCTTSTPTSAPLRTPRRRGRSSPSRSSSPPTRPCRTCPPRSSTASRRTLACREKWAGPCPQKGTAFFTARHLSLKFPTPFLISHQILRLSRR